MPLPFPKHHCEPSTAQGSERTLLIMFDRKVTYFSAEIFFYPVCHRFKDSAAARQWPSVNRSQGLLARKAASFQSSASDAFGNRISSSFAASRLASSDSSEG